MCLGESPTMALAPTSTAPPAGGIRIAAKGRGEHGDRPMASLMLAFLADLASQRKSQRLPQVLGRGEIEPLLATPRGSEPAALRDRALLELMYACGLRASEATGLEVGDLDLRHAILRARGKGSKERLVP